MPSIWVFTDEKDFQLWNQIQVGNWSWRKIVSADPCVYCGKQIKAAKFTLEHILPISLGGHNRWDNKAACCSSCNVGRGSKPLLHYLLFPAKGVQNMWQQVKGPFGLGAQQ